MTPVAKSVVRNVIAFLLFGGALLVGGYCVVAKTVGHSPSVYISIAMIVVALFALELRTGIYRHLFHRGDCEN